MNCYRREFDPWITKFVLNAGAELKTSTLIISLLKEDGKVCGVIDEFKNKYEAPVVIGADGAISMVARQKPKILELLPKKKKSRRDGL
jgi:flavin-dependent dehydrogenase